jgi:hypothetical protein
VVDLDATSLLLLAAGLRARGLHELSFQKRTLPQMLDFSSLQA